MTHALPASLEHRILLVRGHRVMLDADLADLYGVSTKALNQQVKRNIERFPSDFMFRLTAEERSSVLNAVPDLGRLRFSPSLPHVFTEHGAVMLASVVNSLTAVQASIQVVRAFIHLREERDSRLFPNRVGSFPIWRAAPGR